MLSILGFHESHNDVVLVPRTLVRRTLPGWSLSACRIFLAWSCPVVQCHRNICARLKRRQCYLCRPVPHPAICLDTQVGVAQPYHTIRLMTAGPAGLARSAFQTRRKHQETCRIPHEADKHCHASDLEDSMPQFVPCLQHSALEPIWLQSELRLLLKSEHQHVEALRSLYGAGLHASLLGK